MDTNSPVKDILYEEITEISENTIQLEISKGNSSKIIGKLISKCLPRLEKISQNIDGDFGIFAESLMHYFLTLAIIPSQRKVSQNNIEIDIIIPDLKTLEKNPNDALILFFPKSNDDVFIQDRISDIQKIQPIQQNIWLVMHGNLDLKNRIYQINNDTNSFNKILDDIEEFFSSKKQNKFRIMK